MRYQVILRNGERIISTWGTFDEKGDACLVMAKLSAYLVICPGQMLTIREVKS